MPKPTAIAVNDKTKYLDAPRTPTNALLDKSPNVKHLQGERRDDHKVHLIRQVSALFEESPPKQMSSEVEPKGMPSIRR